MNSIKAQQIITHIIAEQQKQQVTRKQYPVAKHQINTLETLGILNLMPAKFGYTDAAKVIDAAQNKLPAFSWSVTDGADYDAIGSSNNPLFVAINEASE
jgi:hypothetical protein